MSNYELIYFYKLPSNHKQRCYQLASKKLVVYYFMSYNPSFPPKNQNPHRMAACLRNFCYLLVVILNTLIISLYNCGSFFLCIQSEI